MISVFLAQDGYCKCIGNWLIFGFQPQYHKTTVMGDANILTLHPKSCIEFITRLNYSRSDPETEITHSPVSFLFCKSFSN